MLHLIPKSRSGAVFVLQMFSCARVQKYEQKRVFLVIQEDNKAKIQSILEHLCVDSKLEIYQKDHSNEIILSGGCVEGLSSCQKWSKMQSTA